MTAKFYSSYETLVAKYKELNLKVVSVSVPGFGYSTCLPGRKIVDWPITDLWPVLKECSVKEFIVSGASFGTPHAMAVAYHFAEGGHAPAGSPKCLGMHWCP